MAWRPQGLSLPKTCVIQSLTRVLRGRVVRNLYCLGMLSQGFVVRVVCVLVVLVDVVAVVVVFVLVVAVIAR